MAKTKTAAKPKKAAPEKNQKKAVKRSSPPPKAVAIAKAATPVGVKPAAKTVTTKKRARANEPIAHRRVTAEIVEPGQEAVEEREEFHPEEAADFVPDGDIEILDAELEPTIIDDDLEGKTKARRLPVQVPSSDDTGVSTTDPVATYLAEIRKYPLLTREQERDLAVRYRETRDPKAAEQLVTGNLRFVVKIAAEYSKFGAKLIDLIQEGNVGLMHAVREFNPYKDVRLITYAVWWIRGYIQEYLMRQYSMVRIGTTQTQRKLFYRLQKEKDLLDRTGQDSSIPLLSSRLGVDEEDVKQMAQRLSGRDVSLNTPLDSSGNSASSLLDFEASNEEGVDERLGHAEELAALSENLEELRPGLNEKELYILDNRILADEPMTLQEIGDHYGVTREAVRQLEARLINRIRTAFAKKIHIGEERGDTDDDV